MSNAHLNTSESDGGTSKVLALVALALAGVAAFFLKDSHYASVAALVGVAGAFAIMILGASREDSPESAPADDGAGALLTALERCRSEYAQQIAGLRKAVDSCKADEIGVKESAAVRAEIAKLRADVAKIV